MRNNKSKFFSDLVDTLAIKKGEMVFISSDIRRIIYDAYQKNQSIPDLNELIDEIIERIGDTGTLLLPTYNWDFCQGKPFNWRETKGKTGSLGNECLKRSDFKRTKHPIYSYAVWGRQKEHLCNIDFKSSFGKNSIFAFMVRNHAKHIMLDVDMSKAFTFVHYVEEKVSNLCYRFNKNFTSEYIDEYGRKSKKTYSMLVRNMLLDVKTDLRPLEEEIIGLGLATKVYYKDITSLIIPDVSLTIPIIEKDIRTNYSRKFCSYAGLKENFGEV